MKPRRMKPALKKVLVTGATGFIGSNLVRRLVNQNYQVHILKREKSNVWRIKDLISRLHIHDIDLLQKEKLSNILQKIKPNIIFHLANLGLYAGLDPNIEDSIKVNSFGTINLIEAAHLIDYDCFINTGSSSEYGIKQTPLNENDVCEPISNYAISKLAGTLYGTSYAKRTRKPLATFRIFSPYGPYDYRDRLISQVILKIIKGERFFSNNPSDVRDYIFINDVVEAYLLCITNNKEISGEIINIGSGKQSYIKDVIRLLTTEMGTNLVSYNRSKRHNIIWQADITKARKILGWQPRKNLREGLKQTILWFKKNSYLYD